MSLAKRCGVAIATRWTLVIFAACKEAMALQSPYDLEDKMGPYDPYKWTHGINGLINDG